MIEVQVKTDSSTESDEMLTRAIALGIALALCVGLVIFLGRRHPEKARALLISFMSVEALLILRICYDFLDFATDTTMLFSEVLPKADAETVKDLVVPWIIFYAISSVVFAAAISMNLVTLVHAIRLHRKEISFEEDQDQHGAPAKLLKHQKNLARATRDIESIYVAMMVSAAENFPLGTLQVIYMVRMKSAGPMSMVSLVTSWWSLGMGVGKVVRLKDFLPYRNKQRRKVKALQALVDLGLELGSIKCADQPTQLLTNTSFIRSNDLLGKILHRGKEEKEAMVAELDKSQEATVPQNH